MNSIKQLSYKVAFSGIICALALITMFLSIIPGLTYALPAVSGIFIWTISEQISKKWALLSFSACSFLSLIMVPELEATAFFISFFGYYPVIRELINRLKNKFISFLLKFIIFNLSMVITFQIISRIIGLDKIIEGMEFLGDFAIYGLWISANIAFVCYDFCLTQIIYAFKKWLKPQFSKRIKP